MVPLPLFKLAALLLRHVSKYGANSIKLQAHEHPKFRAIAARYGQYIHQLNMRVSVAAMKDVAAERRAKEKAEAPKVPTKEEALAAEEKAKKKEAEKKEAERTAAGGGANIKPDLQHPVKKHTHEKFTSVWRRKFRPLPENKAVDLFADVIGDAFILSIAAGLITYEYIKAKQKPDNNADAIAELEEKLKAEIMHSNQIEESERQLQQRLEILEQAFEQLKHETAPQKIRRALSMS